MRRNYSESYILQSWVRIRILIIINSIKHDRRIIYKRNVPKEFAFTHICAHILTTFSDTGINIKSQRLAMRVTHKTMHTLKWKPISIRTDHGLSTRLIPDASDHPCTHICVTKPRQVYRTTFIFLSWILSITFANIPLLWRVG